MKKAFDIDETLIADIKITIFIFFPFSFGFLLIL